jgi:hypothetical protein
MTILFEALGTLLGAVLALLWVYLACRLGALGVLQAFEDFRRRNPP